MGQLLGNRYRFVKTLGSDLCGQTCLAEDIQAPGHPLCVVRGLVMPDVSARTLQFTLTLLRKKAEALKAICANARIPKILAYFEQKNIFYLVEEYIAGAALAQTLQPEHPLSEEMTIQMLREVLEILVFIHSRGIIHRRLKPANLIRSQADNRLVLTGFGIFKEISANAMRSGQPVESLQNPFLQFASHQETAIYISPEQNLGQVQFNTDLYALGMIGIRAVTGLTDTGLAKLRQLNGIGSQTTSWHHLTNVSNVLIEVLDKMVQVDSKHRYQSAAQVLKELDRIAGREETSQELPTTPKKAPIAVAPPPSRLKVWLGIGVGVAALGGLAFLHTQFPATMLSQTFQYQATERERQGQNPEAIEAYSRAIAARPNNGLAYYRRGLIYQRLGRQQAALDDLTQAIELGVLVDEAYYQRGNVRFSLGDRTAAMADYSRAIEARPDYVEAYVNRGSVRAELGDDEGAIADYSRAIQLNGKLAEAYLNRCLSRLNLDDATGALSDCTQAIALKPNYALAYQNRGLVNYRLKQNQAALEDFKVAIQLAPQDADSYYNRGLLRADLGDRQGALADFSTALERNARHSQALYDRGILRLELGEYPEATKDLQQAAQICLDLGRVRCYQDAQYHLKQMKQAGR